MMVFVHYKISSWLLSYSLKSHFGIQISKNSVLCFWGPMNAQGAGHPEKWVSGYRVPLLMPVDAKFAFVAWPLRRYEDEGLTRL